MPFCPGYPAPSLSCGSINSISPSYTADGAVSWGSHYGQQFGGSLRNLKIEIPYDPAIPLMGIYPEKNMIQKDTCTPVFTVALLTTAKTWKQCKCPLTAAAAKSLQSCPTLCDPITAAYQAPPSLGFSRQEHWSGLPFPSPMHESEGGE